MIRPLAMSNPVQFKGYTIMGPDDDENPIPNKENKKTGLTNDERKIFLAGAFLGAVMGIGGTMVVDKAQMNSMLRDMQEECRIGKMDSLKVEDVTDDKVPDIILVGSDGVSTIYDMSKDKVFFEMDGDRVEKNR